MLFFIATQTGGSPRSPDDWTPHLTGRVESHEIACKHMELGQSIHIKTIGRLLEQHLIRRSRELRPRIS